MSFACIKKDNSQLSLKEHVVSIRKMRTNYKLHRNGKEQLFCTKKKLIIISTQTKRLSYQKNQQTILLFIDSVCS